MRAALVAAARTNLAQELRRDPSIPALLVDTIVDDAIARVLATAQESEERFHGLMAGCLFAARARRKGTPAKAMLN